MKRVKGLLVSAALIALSLASCGTKTHHGTYQFQMGKNTDSHIGIYMDLTADKIDVSTDEGKKETMEKFNVRLSVPEVGGEGDASLMGGILTYFKDGISGGYKIEHVEESDDDRLRLFPLIDIAELISEIQEGEAAEEDSSSQEPASSQAESSSAEGSSSLEPYVIPSKYVDDILISKYSKSSISVTAPVSLTDLMFQLYWYGFDLFDIMAENPLPQHPHGSHPTKEDIAKINETFNSDDKMIKHYDLDALIKYQTLKVVDYRDFNQLTMSLAKAVL